MKHGSFTQSVKEEITSLEYSNEEYLPLLSGFIKTNGVLSISSKKLILSLQTENAKVAKLIYKAIVSVFNVSPHFSYARKMKLDKGVVYHLSLDEKVDEILRVLQIANGFESLTPREILEDKGARFFICGVFLASGSVNSPASNNYHLQMIVSSEEDAKFLIRVLNRFKHEKNMDFKYISRRNKYVVYLKKADQITVFLALINASFAMLEFENSRIEKDYINSENRYQICYNANFQKTIQKANEQIEDIKIIDKKKGLIHLSEKEQKLALARLNNPEAPLSTLVELLKEKNIEISKSGASRIFNKFHDLAISLRLK